MPSKRTNDSVDRILEDLGRKQNAEGVRNSVNDSQVDAILKEVMESAAAPAPAGTAADASTGVELPPVALSGVPDDGRFSTAVLDDLLGDLPSLRTQRTADPGRTRPAAAPQPAQPQQQAAQRPQPVQSQKPARQAKQAPIPVLETEPTTQHTATGDTTRTGIIKNFLLKMAPDGSGADADALSQGKNQFQEFFGKSAAVVPDENGRLRNSGKKKHGLFGMPSADETGEFVPINVSLGSGKPVAGQGPQNQNQNQDTIDILRGAMQQPEPVEEPERPERAARPKNSKKGGKKGGIFGGLFGGRNAPQEEAEEWPDEREQDETDLPLADSTPLAQEPAREQPAAPRAKSVYRSGTGAIPLDSGAKRGLSATLSGFSTTLERLKIAPKQEQDVSATGTVYRKKRDTVEFTPGQHSSQKPTATQNFPTHHKADPVGEPVMTPSVQLPIQQAPSQPEHTPQQTTTGFTIQMERQGGREDTQSFLAELNAGVSTRRKAASQSPQAVPAKGADTSTFEELSVEQAKDLTAQILAEQTLTGLGTGQVRIGQPAPSNAAPSSFVHHIEQSINSQATASFAAQTGPVLREEERYQAAAARLLGTAAGQEDDETDATGTSLRGKTHLSGTPRDEQNTGTLPFIDAPTHAPRHDYETAEDAPIVRKDLDKQVLALGVSSILAGILGALLFYLGLAAITPGVPLPAPLAVAGGTAPLLITMLVLLAVTCAACWRTFFEGLRGIVRNPSPDSMPALASIGALVQLIAFLAMPAWYDAAKFCLLAGPAALLLCFNTIGKWVDARTIANNFDLVSAGVDHAVAYRLKDAAVLRAVTKGLGEPRPSVLVSRPTQLLKDFLANSSAHRTSDKNQQQFAWLLAGCGLVALVFTALYHKNAGMAVTAMATVFCLGSPLAGTLLSAVPARLMQRSAAQVGAVIPGWKDIRQLGRINVIQITTQDLFPSGCISLGGIKAERIDLAIPYAVSMLTEENDALRTFFMSMIGDNTKLLYPVENLEVVYGQGSVGWIKGQRVIIGNRALMERYHIEMPTIDYERRHTVKERHTVDQCRIVYLAVAGKLFSMFQISYQRDQDTAVVLDSLRRAGMSLIVDCDDFNCDSALLEAVYGLPTGTVKVLNGKERAAMAPATAWLPESEGNMLHLGSFSSFVGGLEAAAGAAEGERKAAMVVSATVLFGCVLAVIMALAGGIASLPLPALVLYQLAWAVLAMIFPLLQRY